MSKLSGRRQPSSAALLFAVLLSATALPLPGAHADPPIAFSAETIRTWERDGLRFLLLEGEVFAVQNGNSIRADRCLIWTRSLPVVRGEPASFEFSAAGNVRVARINADIEHLDRYSTQWRTDQGYTATAGKEVRQASGEEHPLFVEAFQNKKLTGNGTKVDDSIRQTAFQEPAPVFDTPNGPLAAPPNNAAAPIVNAQPGLTTEPASPGGRRGGQFLPKPSRDPNARRLLTLNPRSSKLYQLEKFDSEAGDEITVVSGGVAISVEEPATGNLSTIATDRAVIWRRGPSSGAAENPMAQDVSQQRVEIYLEGNVQIHIGNANSLDRSQQIQLSGKQIYFDVNREQALVLDGVVETYDARLRAPLLMNAERLFMFSQDKFFGEKSRFTTSPYRGRPGYEFAASEFYLDRVKRPIVNPFTGEQAIGANGQPLVRSKNFGTGYNNVLRVDDVPIFYTPYLRADIEHPLGPIETIKFGNTQRLGVTTSVTLDAWRLFGLDYLEAADRFSWLFDVGYYSARGPAGGTRVTYFGKEPIDRPGAYFGRLLTWWIKDEGRDFLGPERNDLIPSEEVRGRALFQHRQTFDNDCTLIASFAYLSDQNFLQSFFQNDFDTAPDQETFLYFKQARDYWGWTLLAQPRAKDFLPQNASLPRADLHILGKSFLGDRLTYFSRSSIGYFEVRPPDSTPLLGTPTFDANLNTARLDTRHEVDLPLRIGDLTVTPFVVGQFTGYNHAVDGDPLGRLYGAGGLRTSLPFWRVFPNVQSSLLNLQGLAHKVTLYGDYLYAASSVDQHELPYIDQLDDDTSDLVRRTNLFRTFLLNGKPVPNRYDPRFEGLRRDPFFASPEVLDDLHVVRLGVEQRLQTKRGPIGAERIIDWMTLDTNATYFPDSQRDNLGKPFGLIDYTYRWHLGDRTSILSNGNWEPLDGTNDYNATLAMQRPPRSLLSIFYSHYSSGPFDSNFVGFNSSYRFSYKYSGYVASTIDFAQLDQVSYQFGFTRIGLDFITHLTVAFNAGRKDFGFRFEILPRVAPRNAYGRGVLTTLPFGVDPGETVLPVGLDRLGLPQDTSTQPF